jgi:hypothetical protein
MKSEDIVMDKKAALLSITGADGVVAVRQLYGLPKLITIIELYLATVMGVTVQVGLNTVHIACAHSV